MDESEAGTPHHLSRGHTNGFDRELAPTHVEQILQTGPEQINDEDVVESFLSKVVYLRDTGCRRLSVSCTREGERERRGQTDDIQREYDRNDTRHGAAAPLPFVVPGGQGEEVGRQTMPCCGMDQEKRTHKLDGDRLGVEQVGAYEETGSPSAPQQSRNGG